MQIPKHWDSISVSQYKGLKRVFSAPSESIAERYIDVLIEITEEDIEDIEDLPVTELKRIANELFWLKKEPHKKYAKTIGEFELMDFKKITWGVFIDLEHYYSKDYIDNIETICGILYRTLSVDGWKHKQIEPYNYDPIERGKLFSDLPITSIYGVVSEYLTYRNYLVDDAYIHLFGGSFVDEEEEDLTPEEKKELEKEQRFNKWAFESLTLELAQGDITKMKDVLNLPLIYVLNILSMKKDLI